MKKTLLLVAHGSRREASNDEVRELAARLAAMEHEFGAVDCAFLELAEPSIPDGIRQALDSGADQVVVLPYFLSAGRHVASDIPGEIEVVRRERPGADILLSPYLGAAEGIAGLLLGQASGSPAS